MTNISAEKILQLEKRISDLESDIKLLISENTNLYIEGKAFFEDVSKKFNHLVRNIALEIQLEEQDVADLEKEVININIKLLNDLTEFIKSNIYSIKARKFLWNDELTGLLEQFDDIDKAFSEESRCLTENELLNHLKEKTTNEHLLWSKVKKVKKRFGYKMPLNILFYGVPILIGVFVSGKVNFTQSVLLCIGLLIIILSTYLIMNEKITMFIKNSIGRFSMPLQMASSVVVGIVITVGMISTIEFPKYILRKAMTISVKDAISQASNNKKQVFVYYTVGYNRTPVAYDVSINTEAPGLLVESPRSTFNIIGAQGAKGLIEVTVPDSTPKGEYEVIINCYFKSKMDWPSYLPLSDDWKSVDKKFYTTIKVD